MLETTPSRPSRSLLQTRHYGGVHLGKLIGGQRPGRAAPSIQIAGEPLDGRRQGRGHRIAGRHRRDILLRIHPQYQPCTSLDTRRAIIGSWRFGRVGGLGDVSLSHRDDIDGVKLHIELVQRRSDHRHRQGGRRYHLALMAPGRPVGLFFHGDHRDQLALVLAHPDRVAAEAAPVIDRGRASPAQCRHPVAGPIPHPPGQS
jgi:hypothetical protein